jgi:hypothetical protein
VAAPDTPLEIVEIGPRPKRPDEPVTIPSAADDRRSWSPAPRRGPATTPQVVDGADRRSRSRAAHASNRPGRLTSLLNRTLLVVLANAVGEPLVSTDQCVRFPGFSRS